MSTSYCTDIQISAHELFGGRLQEYGICEYVDPTTDPTWRCLTDGGNYVWVSINEDGSVDRFVRFGMNSALFILNTIASQFLAQVFSEHDYRFWGFESQYAWDASMEAPTKADEDELYFEIIKFVSGKDTGLRPGTNGMKMAEIAKELIGRNPHYASPSAKGELMSEIGRIYEEKYAVKISLSAVEAEFFQTLCKLSLFNGPASKQEPQ